MKEIPLTKGFKAIVDDDDYEWLVKWKWQYTEGYAIRQTYINKKNNTVSMHREIMNPPKGMQVDHINHDTLDNRRVNLRICTPKENSRNCKRPSNNTSGYKGVSWHTAMGKWTAVIRVDRKVIAVGYFDDVIDAALAYDEAARKYHGEFAHTNF